MFCIYLRTASVSLFSSTAPLTLFSCCFFFGFNTWFSVNPPASCVSCYLLTAHTPTPSSIHLSLNRVFFENIQCDHFFLPLTWVSFSAIEPCHTVMIAVLHLFLSMLSLYLLFFISSLFACHRLQLFFFFTFPLFEPDLLKPPSFSCPILFHSHHRTCTIFGCLLQAVSVARSQCFLLLLSNSASCNRPHCVNHICRDERKGFFTKVWKLL